MILFLNKKDIFEEKLKKGNNANFCPSFSEYKGELFPEACLKYLQTVFKKLPKNQSKSVYPHLTLTTDTNSVKHVFKDIILQQAIKNIGF